MQHKSYLTIRVLEESTTSQIKIGAPFQTNDLEAEAERIKDLYDQRNSWCGGFQPACEKYYKRIALVNAVTLAVVQPIYTKEA